MTLQPFKFELRAILLESDESGNPVGERLSEPITVYGRDAVIEWLDLVDNTANHHNANNSIETSEE